MPVKKGDKWTYADHTGRLITEPAFDMAWDFGGDGYAVVSLDGKCGVIDGSGSFVIAPEFDSIGY